MLSYRKLKTDSTLCVGVRPGHKIQYKCTACGHTGCRQSTEGRCTHQGFNVLFGCLKCGVVGKQEVLV
jgi:uncharacterized ferredoxin-like protein